MCRGAKPSLRIFSYILHSNPRRLLDINILVKGSNERDTLILADEFSKILHDIRVGGVWKRTSPGRLPLTTEAIVKNLPEKIKSGKVLDIGASDGCTSADLVRALDEKFNGAFQVYMADLYLWLDVWKKSVWTEYRSTQGLPVMVEVGGFGMRLPKSEHRWDILGSALAKLYLSLAGFRKSFTYQDRIPLINPLAQALGEGRVFPIEMDCLQYQSALKARFDVIRASNILNFGYFTPEQLQIIVGHLHDYLREDGILVVSRNEGTALKENEGGIVWQKAETGFVRVDCFGQGSEIDSLVDTFVVT